MKIFISIKKKWLQHRVYKYTLKYNDALAKSKRYFKMSSDFHDNMQHFANNCSTIHEFRKFSNLSKKYDLKSNHYKTLSDIYLDKKIDLDEALSILSYKKV